MRAYKLLADLLSIVFMPQISSIYAFALLFLYVNPDTLYLFIAILFSSFIQLLSILYYITIAKGDANIFNKENRLPFFVIAILSYFIGFILLRNLAAPFIFTALMLSYLINTVAAAFITKYFTKVSIHVWGISGPSVAIFYCYGFFGLFSMLALAAIIGLARIETRQHDLFQVLLSFALSLPITFFIIYVLSPLVI